jgi:hypothetical protein
MKNFLLPSLLFILLFSNKLYSQNPCNLFNSVTLNVNIDSAIVDKGQVPWVTTGTLPVIDTNAWNYIAITKDNGNNWSVYKNGILMYNGTSSSAFNWNRIDIGATFYTSYAGWFKGWIDEIRMSNTVRSAANILNTYNSGLAMSSDANTIGLWHFDQTTGTTLNATTGTNGSLVNSNWDVNGRFGNCLYFNGTNARTIIPQSVPNSNMTFEFWLKPDSLQTNSPWPISWYGSFTSGFALNQYVQYTPYTWSSGQIGNSITVNPSTLPYVWVSNGTCNDTIFFNSQSATIYDTTNVTVFDTTNITIYDTLTINVYDTITTYTSVTDTLIISTNITGLNPPSNTNTFLVYPNPASTHITIDNGNYALLGNYSIRISNQLGQVVFNQIINQQQFYIDLSTWTGSGLYYLDILDNNGNVVENRKIVIQ